MNDSNPIGVRYVARAPVRVDPAGGGTDAPPYCLDHGGAVVNFSLNRYAYAALRWTPEGSGIRFHSLDQRKSKHVSRIEEFTRDGELDLLKAAVIRMMPDDRSFELVTQSDVPERTGLGGSGAMGVALVAVIAKALGRAMTLDDIAQCGNALEREDLGFAGGSQDSYAAAYGGAKLVTYHQGGGTQCRRLRLHPALQYQLERDTLLVYTGSVHLSGSIHADIKAGYALPNSPTVLAMNGLKASALEMAEALPRGDIKTVCRCLNESRLNHYALHPSCDSEVLRRFFSELHPFILGGKTCGAGGGGFVFLVMHPDRRRECMERARELGGQTHLFKFDREGVVTWEEQCL